MRCRRIRQRPVPAAHRAPATEANLKKFGRFAQFVRPALPAILQCAPLRISDFISAGIFSSARRTKCAPRNGSSETRRRTRSKRRQTNAGSTAAITARRTNSSRRPSANAIRPDLNAKGGRETRNWTIKKKLQIYLPPQKKCGAVNGGQTFFSKCDPLKKKILLQNSAFLRVVAAWNLEHTYPF